MITAHINKREGLLMDISLNHIETIRKICQSRPKHEWNKICRTMGVHSPDNARGSHLFQPFKLNSEMK